MPLGGAHSRRSLQCLLPRIVHFFHSMFRKLRQVDDALFDFYAGDASHGQKKNQACRQASENENSHMFFLKL